MSSVSFEEYLKFDRYHNYFCYESNTDKRIEGCMLHHLFKYEIPITLLVKLIKHFHPCCIVQDDDGNIPLHVAVMHNMDADCIRLLLLLSPQGIVHLKNFRGFSSVQYALQKTNKVDETIIHAILDFTHGHIDGSNVMLARMKCKAVARIFIRRRLIAKNRDVSWLVALEIWTTRADSVWNVI